MVSRSVRGSSGDANCAPGSLAPILPCIPKGRPRSRSCPSTSAWRAEPPLWMWSPAVCVLAELGSFCPLRLVLIDLCAKSQPFFQTVFLKVAPRPRALASPGTLPQTRQIRNSGGRAYQSCFSKPFRGLTPAGM